MNRKRIIDFLTLVLFFGIILSVTVYFGIGAAIKLERGDGGKGEDARVGGTFADAFYGDENLSYFIRYANYKFFRHTSAENTLIGEDGWIFETVSADGEYDYLLDYVGGASFSEAELSRIASALESERIYYEERGIEYLVVVIPSSMSVCKDKLPSFLGDRSDETRLALLTEYLSGESAYIDPTESLVADYATETPYNNTEDSINAYGAYSIYNTVMTRLSSDSGAPMLRLRYEEIPFSVRMTDGKTASSRAGLEKIVKNRTVSLTEEMTVGYTVTEHNSSCITTQRADGGADTPTLLVELPSEWERIQLMPLFSNTFNTVIYENSGVYMRAAVETHSPDIVVRMIRESDLDALLK